MGVLSIPTSPVERYLASRVFGEHGAVETSGREEKKADAQPARILIAEDESLLALDLSMTVEQIGFEVCGVTATGAGAVRLADELVPDLILMDIQLDDDVDGITAAERIHAAQGVPIVFITAYSDNETTSRINRLNRVSILSKPVMREVLSAAIHNVLNQVPPN